MKKSILALAVALVAGAPMVASADSLDQYLKDRLTVGASYDMYKNKAHASDLDFGIGSVHAEYKIIDSVGYKFEYSTGLKNDSMAGVTYDLDRTYTNSVTLDHPIAAQTNLIGEVGYSTARATAKTGETTVKKTEHGWFYMAGLKYDFQNGFDVQAQVGDLKDQTKAEFYELGASYNFSNSPFSASVAYTAPFSTSDRDYSNVRATLNYSF